ncbi:MAG: Abi family protein [Gammaproteobacteria bacterium]|nr:MAG: Abi family protein [Gammaproteobacteria bacterium]UTW43613.1 Abi family protein [bacterium SCSIO 12844]
MNKKKEAFIGYYIKKYSSPKLPPMWMSIHLLTFKELVILYQNISYKNLKSRIASTYGLKDPVLSSWMRSLSDLRNFCAHHSRIWNRVFGSNAVLPKVKPKHWLKYLPGSIGNNKIVPKKSLYYQVVIIWYFLSQMNIYSTWLERVEALSKEHNIDMIYLRFPLN